MEGRAQEGRLERYRIRLGLSAHQAAAMAGVSYAGYLRAEKPAYEPRERRTGEWTRTTEAIAQAFWHAPEDLFPTAPADDHAAGTEISDWSASAARAPDALFDEKELATQARWAVARLDERRQLLIGKWIGLEDDAPETYRQIAAREGVSVARVADIIAKGIRKLRYRSTVARLRDFWIRTPRDEKPPRPRVPPYPVIACNCGARRRLTERLKLEEIEERVRVGSVRCECGSRPSHVMIDWFDWRPFPYWRWDYEEEQRKLAEASAAALPVGRQPVVRKRHMARPANFASLSRDDLLLAVQALVAQRRVTPQEIRAAAERSRKIAALEGELRRLRGGGDGAPARSARVAPAAPVAKAKRKITNTPKRVAAMRRQGQYLAALRKLKGADAARLKVLAKAEGVPAALKLAAKLLA